jgi:hypothetical protein
MTRLRILGAGTLAALAGCSNDLESDIAACRANALEVHKAARVSEEKVATYLRECMIAEGWPLRDICLDSPHMWDSPQCYLR